MIRRPLSTRVGGPAVAAAVLAVAITGCDQLNEEPPVDEAEPASALSSPAAEQPTATPAADEAAAATARFTKLTFQVDGMTCGGCETAVDAAVRKIAGVEDCEVSHKDGTAIVYVSDPNVADEIEQAVAERRFTCELQTTEPPATG